MNIDYRIKEAFRKDKRMREAIRWDPENQPNIYELNNFLRKSGYRLIEIITQSSGTPELVIEAVKVGYLYPEIHQDLSDNKFYVKVTEYGLLGASDLEGIIQGYSNALEVVKHLDNIDLNDLEIEEE